MTKKQNGKVKDPAYKLSVRRSSAGLGLFADEPIPRGVFIIEYFGPILTQDESDEKGGRYLFEVAKNAVIDGSSRNNIARYINHACRPNCETDIVRGRVYVYSLRAIKEGEELNYDYGKEYVDDFIKPYGCKCKSCLT
ncbi:MAG: SET domain-containing protein [Candidatus Kaiserbacteria bacterium]|nr:SET domain-containing protein [Candidatus Kaiserbacteria bacterium]